MLITWTSDPPLRSGAFRGASRVTWR
jgi:hypothetical protein